MQAQLVLENVGVRYPNRVLFEGVNWTLYQGTRLTLAGRNGCGKSTLLKILAGNMEPHEGKRNVVGGKKLKIGFLDQSLLDSAVLDINRQGESSLSPVALISKRLEGTSEELDREWEVRKILDGLGFSEEWMDNPINRLSGGWLLRVFIAETLLKKPDVLLLDEPTNHLDLSSIQWLEEFLEKEFEGSLILVTHDVALQRRTTDSLAVVHGGRFFYRSNFSDYISFRDSLSDEKRLIGKSIETLEKKIEENMDFFMRFRAKAQTAARAQSKLKAAEVLQEEKKALQDRLVRISGNTYNMQFRFRLAGTGGKFPVSAKELSFRYSENTPWILKNVHFDVKRGQRVAIIGDNGAGKTTLLNVLASRLKPSEGEVQYGHAVEMGYFGQHQLDELSLDNSVLDNVRSQGAGVSFEEIRGWLGAFGFSTQDEVDKKAKVLSGGERARLALLRILVTRINFCLLDEPTNHLDIETKELLKDAIKEFEGTTIFVSHDRQFVSAIAERILYLTHDHQVIDHLGDLESFFAKYPQFVKHTDGAAQPSQAPRETGESKAAIIDPSLSHEERKKIKNRMKTLEKRVSSLEEELTQIGEEKDKVQSQTTDPSFMANYSEGDRNAAYQRLSALESRLHERMVEWEKLSTELESLKSNIR